MASEDELVSQELMEKPIPTFESYITAALHKGLDESTRVAERVTEKRGDIAAKPVPARTYSGQRIPPKSEASLSSKALMKPPHAIAVAPVAAVAIPAPDSDKAQAILELTIQFAFVAARCDGHLALAEKSWIENHFKTRYRHDFMLSNCANALCAYYESAAVNVDDCLVRINQEFTAGHKVALVKMAYEIAAIDGPINQREAKSLHKICQRLMVPAPVPQMVSSTPPVVSTTSTLLASSKASSPAVSRPPTASQGHAPAALAQRNVTNAVVPSAASAIMARRLDANHAEIDAKSSRDQLLTILEIETSAPLSADVVRRHYTRLMGKYAPEKVQALGSDVVAVIQRKRHEVEVAARALMAQWNEELIPKNSQPIPPDLRHNPDLDALFGA